jgi:hypothetical protein
MTLSNQVAEALNHTQLVSGPSIHQIKQHGYVIVRTKRGDEGCGRLVGLLHHNLVVAEIGVEKGQQFALRGGINHLVDMRPREWILRACFVQASVVNAHPPLHSLLSYQHWVS